MLKSVPEILRSTIDLYRYNARLILKYIGVLFVVSILLTLNTIFGMPLLTIWLFGLPGLILGVIIQILILYFSALISIALQRALVKCYHNVTPDSLWHETKAAKKLFWHFLGATILLTIIVAGGTLLLLIPGVILVIYLYFAPYAAVVDGQGPITSLKTSRSLVTGRFWIVLWRLAVPMFIYVFIFSAIRWMILTPGQLIFLNTGMIAVYWISIILAIIFYFLFIPVSIITSLILYENLKENPLIIQPTPQN